MNVNGLPPIKLGHKGDRTGLDVIDQRIDSWRLERIAKIRARLSQFPTNEHQSRLNPLVDSYLLAPTPPRQTALLLEEVAQIAGGLAPATLMDKLRTLRSDVDRRASDEASRVDLEMLMTAVRGLRSEPTAWDDDGWLTAARVLALARRGAYMSEDEQNVIRETLDDGGPSKEDLARIAELRRTLLLRLSRLQTRDRSGATIRADVAHLLVQIREAVDRATRPRRLGPDAVAAKFVEELENDPIAVRRAVLAYTPVYAATCQQSAGHEAAVAKGSDLHYESVLVDEAARADPLDLLIPMAQARRRAVLVGDHRQLPHLIDRQILDELADGIGDESPKERTEAAIRNSLFERLFTDFAARTRRGEPLRTVTLNEQFRMHRALGDFISQEFYDGRLKSSRPDRDFVHGLAPFGNAPAAWIDVPADEGVETKTPGHSKAREAEAEAIGRRLPELMDSPAGRALSFGVIAFYRGQASAIGQKLLHAGLMEPDGSGALQVAAEWRWLTRPRGNVEPRLQVGTVDAFQGREFDVVLLSVARSNTLPEHTVRDRQLKYGHLMSLNRLCVAMSRQRKLLIVVGDGGMLVSQHAEAAIGPLVRFRRLCEREYGIVL
ncbi:DEAD/DEAH box helicase [Planctomycetota bacterium]